MKVYQDWDDSTSVSASQLAGIFKTIEPYNEQYQNTTKDDAKGYPALYFELLEPINWTQAGNGYQTARVRSKMHVVSHSLSRTKQSIHSISQNVLENFSNKRLFIDSTEIQLTTEWVRVASSLPKRFNNLRVVIIDFEFDLIDTSLMPNLTGAPGETTFTIQPTLQQ